MASTSPSATADLRFQIVSAPACSPPMAIPARSKSTDKMDLAPSSACSISSSSSSFHTPECSCSPSCSFHPPFSSLHDRDGESSSSLPDQELLSIEEVLPVEVMQHVLGFVPLEDLAGDVARTSRLWRSLALDPALWLPHWRDLHFARPNVELPESDARRGVQPPPEGAWRDERGGESDPWLLDAGRSLQQAFDDDHPIDWRREYARRKNLSVLVVTYHTSHSNHYDMDTIRQLKKFGIHADICHLMCSHDAKTADAAGGFYNYVEYDDNLFMKYDTIIYFAAMSGGEAMKKTLGDGLLAYLKSGGGVIFCIYTHMKSYQLAGKWSESFYPIKPAAARHYAPPADSHQKREKIKHTVMTGVRNTQIDTTRLGSRSVGAIDPRAKVVGEYEDGVPLVVVLDGEANRAKAREEEAIARDQDEQENLDGGSEHGGDQPEKQDESQQEAEWGKTVFLNFFPVSKDDPCTGGWYDWNSDLPLLLRNAVLFAARKGASYTNH